jgi:DNA invertase Pin-like site-specific DNA recombinase
LAGIVVEVMERAVGVVTLHARVCGLEGMCPRCGGASGRVHGRYVRRLADAAVGGMRTVLAELQRELIVANTMDGLASARARGRVGGRRPRLSEGQAALAQELYDARVKTVQQIADLFGVPRSTMYGHLNKETTVSRQPKKKSLEKA